MDHAFGIPSSHHSDFMEYDMILSHSSALDHHPRDHDMSVGPTYGSFVEGSLDRSNIIWVRNTTLFSYVCRHGTLHGMGAGWHVQTRGYRSRIGVSTLPSVQCHGMRHETFPFVCSPLSASGPCECGQYDCW